MYLVYLKYWTLNLMPLMVYSKVLFHPNFSIKVLSRESLLEDSWQRALQLPREGILPADPAAAVTALQRLHDLLGSGHDSPRLRHLAFMLLQRMAGLPPSLFKEPVEELLPTGDPVRFLKFAAESGEIPIHNYGQGQSNV